MNALDTFSPLGEQRHESLETLDQIGVGAHADDKRVPLPVPDGGGGMDEIAPFPRKNGIGERVPLLVQIQRPAVIGDIADDKFNLFSY